MNQPMTLKQNGQINVVLNGERQLTIKKDSRALPNKKEEHHTLKWIEQAMNELVGMEQLKQIVEEIYAWIYINNCRKEKGLKVEKQVLHMLFKGNPGTGKTTVARLLGKMFQQMNVLSKGHLIEVERADLVGEYIGHTAQKTREMIKKATGGILFVDEAYSLARGGEKDFGKEAVDTLVKSMEDLKHDFMLILAGYSDEMDYFMSLNPGLPSRFPIVIHFPDYSVDELLEITRRMLKEREYQLHPEAEWKIKEHLITERDRHGTLFSNGRYIRNLIEKSIRKQATRLLVEGRVSKFDLQLLKEEDFMFTEESSL